MKYLKVEITQEDIDQGQKPWYEMGGFSYSRAESCPIAHALKRVGYDEVQIMGDFGVVDGKKVRLGAKARDFLSASDLHFRAIGGNHNGKHGIPLIAEGIPAPKPTTVRLMVENF